MNNSADPHIELGRILAGSPDTRGKACENFFGENPAQLIDNSRFGRENPRKSKEIQ
jgi:hypothetical protein